MQIDCHILMPIDSKRPPEWAAELRSDLDREPVVQHWIPGVPGSIGEARARGYECGTAPFVSFADPDDRIFAGVFNKLLQALEQNPNAPYAWAGELVVDQHLKPLILRPVVEHYDASKHQRNIATYVHGVMLFRRSHITGEVLSLIRQTRYAADAFLAAYLAGLCAAPPPFAAPPIAVPILGRMWRHHGANAHKLHYKAEDTDTARALLGLPPRQSKSRGVIEL